MAKEIRIISFMLVRNDDTTWTTLMIVMTMIDLYGNRKHFILITTAMAMDLHLLPCKAAKLLPDT